MQFAVDLAKRDYLLRSNRQNQNKTQNNHRKEVEPQKPSYMLEPTFTDKATAMFTGTAIAGVISGTRYATSRVFLGALQKISGVPRLEESQEAAIKIVKDMGFENSVKVIFVEDSEEERKKLASFIAKDSSANAKKFLVRGKSGFFDDIIKWNSEAKAFAIAMGGKASYLINEQVAATSKKNASLIFHELGKAKVAHNKWLKPLLFFNEDGMVHAGVVGLGLLALTHTPDKRKLESKKGLIEKSRDFLDNNIEEITLLTYLPALAGKGLSSFYGVKAAKPYLADPQIKYLKRVSLVGLGMYGATALAASIGINMGNKVQNNIIRQKNSPQDVYNLLI